MESPRIDVVFRLWQCDKKNHGGVKARRRPFPAKVSICWPGLHPPGKISFERKKNTALCCGPLPRLRTLAALKRPSRTTVVRRLTFAGNPAYNPGIKRGR